MSARYLHIVSFNIPFPADYGGIIDIFYKLKALKEAGVHIILHCFEYGRQPSRELEGLCFRVHYYPRKTGLKYYLRSDPYIVATRSSDCMPDNLLKDPFPVLFEGLHTTGMLIRCVQARKKVMVRAHNIEHRYYHGLSKSEASLHRKIFFRTESAKLKRYEQVLQHTDHILGIAKHETAYFNETFGNAIFIPAFHRFEEVTSIPGRGDYILFHGNLGVAENSGIIRRLVSDSLAGTPYPVVVAGKDPSEKLIKKLTRHPRISVIPNPSHEELDRLIQNAQVNLLHTIQSTGIKLKLIHALFSGRHCLVNSPMVEGTGFAPLCHVADHRDDLLKSLEKLMTATFVQEHINARKKALVEYSNRAGAEKILRLLG